MVVVCAVGGCVYEYSWVHYYVEFWAVLEVLADVAWPKISSNCSCWTSSPYNLTGFGYIVVLLYIGHLSFDYLGTLEIQRWILIFDRLRSIALMQRAITVSKYKLSPVRKRTFSRISRQVSLAFKLIRPQIRTTKYSLTSLIALLDNLGLCFPLAESSAFQEYYELIRLCSLVDIQGRRSSIQAFGIRVGDMHDFLVFLACGNRAKE